MRSAGVVFRRNPNRESFDERWIDPRSYRRIRYFLNDCEGVLRRQSGWDDIVVIERAEGFLEENFGDRIFGGAAGGVSAGAGKSICCV